MFSSLFSNQPQTNQNSLLTNFSFVPSTNNSSFLVHVLFSFVALHYALDFSPSVSLTVSPFTIDKVVLQKHKLRLFRLQKPLSGDFFFVLLLFSFSLNSSNNQQQAKQQTNHYLYTRSSTINTLNNFQRRF